MRKTLIALIVGLLVSVNAKPGVPLEAFPLVNSLHDLWTSGKTEAAVDSTVRLYQVYPPLLVEMLHNTVPQLIKQDRFYENINKYLEAINGRNNQGVNRIIKPVYVWSKTLRNTDRNQLDKRFNEMVQVLGDSSDFQSKAERYALLMLNEPAIQQSIDKGAREKLLLTVIRNLERYPNLNVPVTGTSELRKRAWNRYLLAYGYYFRYTMLDKQGDYLLKAFKYSPDLLDDQVSEAYTYDAFMLTGNVRQFGFQNVYLNYLTDNHKTREALAVLTEIAFNAPTDQNLNVLKAMYAKEMPGTSFSEYWFKYFNQKAKKTPSLKIDFAEGALDLTKNRARWVYVDVWGTWCEPCVKELPTLQEFFVENSRQTSSTIKIYTFSYASTNLDAFMKEKGFTFPVVGIDDKVKDAFSVSSYPSKLLISPEGYYIKIPYGVDWKMYIKNYTLTEA